MAEQQGFLRWAWDWLKAIAVAIILAFVIRTYLFAPVLVDGESMMPTLTDRERLIMNKFSYLAGEPEREDIVVFHATVERDFIKRIIARAGDTVEMKNDVLYINGKEVAEPYLAPYKQLAKEEGKLPLTADFGPLKVPKDHVFVMGDNRQNSRDSRDPSVGPVKEDRIVGKAQFVFWPFRELRMVD